MPDKPEPQAYDKILKENLEGIILSFAFKYLGIQEKNINRLPEQLQTTTQREVDFLAKVKGKSLDKDYLLHIEFQTRPEKNMVLRMQEYHAIIYRKYKIPIKHFVIHLGQENTKMRSSLEESEIFRGFTLVSLKDLDYKTLLSAPHAGEIILAILADYKNNPPEVIIRFILQQLKSKVDNPVELEKYVKQLIILAKLRKLDNVVHQNSDHMPLDIKIEESGVYQVGHKRGIEQGKEINTRETIRKFLMKGYPIKFIHESLEVPLKTITEVQQQIEQEEKDSSK